MPLPLPNLHDRTYTDLVNDALARIPQECPEWTDHTPSDTGIILLELLAWLTEMVLYRVNQIPDKNIETFLRLLTEGDGAGHANLQEKRRQVLTDLNQRYRAVTPQDYEHLTLDQWNQTAAAKKLGKIKRVRCVPQCNLSTKDMATKQADVSNHISLVVVPELSVQEQREDADKKLKPPQPTEEQLKSLREFFEPRRILTTCLHVVHPEYVRFQLSATLYLKAGADANEKKQVKQNAEAAAHQFCHPLDSGAYWQGQGWPFGRNIYASEFYQLLSQLAWVDHVENVSLSGFRGGKSIDQSSSKGIAVAAHQLVALTETKFELK
jgi:hypothetical protein